MIPTKRRYSLSSNDFSDSYIICYDAGSMGDFFTCLLMMSYYIKAKEYMPDVGPTDRYFYSCETKKWMVVDSSDNGLRHFTSNDNIRSIRKYKLTDNANMNTVNELAYSLISMTKFYPEKLKAIPYFFTSENLLTYLNNKPIQSLNQGNLIYVHWAESPDMIKNILKFYKNYMWSKFRFRQSTMMSKSEFVDTVTYDIKRTASDKYKKIPVTDLKTSKKFDISKLLFDNDVQGLDVIDTENTFISNMISLAKKDVNDILEFYGYNLYTAAKLTINDVEDVYDRMICCHST